jgi:ferric-dicitrate binding protein FerR (iron transport regulator)
VNSSNTTEERIAKILSKVDRREEPPQAAADAVRANVHRAWKLSLEEKRARRRRHTSLAAVASLLLFLGAAVFLQFPAKAPATIASVDEQVNALEFRTGDGDWQILEPAAGRELTAGDQLRTGSESFAALTTAEGLRIRLDEDSELKLLADNEIFLASGAVYVNAGGAPALTVNTVHGTARDIGTKFEVRVAQDGWRVQVRDGQVVIDDKQAGSAMANAGERVHLRPGAPIQRETIPASDGSWAWTHAVAPAIDIENATLASYLDWWSAESGKTVRFDAPGSERLAADTRLHGSIASMSLAEGFAAVLATSGYRVVDLSAEEIILAR